MSKYRIYLPGWILCNSQIPREIQRSSHGSILQGVPKMKTKTGFRKSVKMVLAMSLYYWLYLKKRITNFFHITHIQHQLNALSENKKLVYVAVQFWSYVLSRFCLHFLGDTLYSSYAFTLNNKLGFECMHQIFSSLVNKCIGFIKSLYT